MTDTTADAFGALSEPATLTIRRLLPGPIERVWAYLTEGDLRRQWLAAGAMELKVGAPFEFVWRNDELTHPPGRRPPGFDEEQRMRSVITEVDPPRKLSFTWNRSGDVTFALDPQGADVLLTITHRRAPDRSTLLLVSAGWHAHLDVLAARLAGTTASPFWDGLMRLKQDYAERMPP